MSKTKNLLTGIVSAAMVTALSGCGQPQYTQQPTSEPSSSSVPESNREECEDLELEDDVWVCDDDDSIYYGQYYSGGKYHSSKSTIKPTSTPKSSSSKTTSTTTTSSVDSSSSSGFGSGTSGGTGG
ncbi:hypothetical protein ACFFIX_14830 [Metabacillus herbersteinensis]|uniref:Aminotransferase yhxA n=1 Tax=Metabacillus herbersteinensis TaxID=283816 RepID=A0ABV6GGA0_9BACI